MLIFDIGRLAACASASLALSCAEPALAQAPSGPMPPSRETFGDWVVECFGEADGAAPCQAYQRVLTQDPQVVALAIAISRQNVESGAAIEIALPLGVSLVAPPVLAIGDDSRINLAWSRCISTGCLVQGSLDNAFVVALMNADTAAIDVTDPTGNIVTIPVSTEGFKDALARLAPTAETNTAPLGLPVAEQDEPGPEGAFDEIN